MLDRSIEIINAVLRDAGSRVKIVKVVGRVAGIPICVDPDQPEGVASIYSNHIEVGRITNIGARSGDEKTS